MKILWKHYPQFVWNDHYIYCDNCISLIALFLFCGGNNAPFQAHGILRSAFCDRLFKNVFGFRFVSSVPGAFCYFFFQVGNVLGFCCLWPFCFFSASFLLTCFRPKSTVEGGGRYVTPPFFLSFKPSPPTERASEWGVWGRHSEKESVTEPPA